MAITRLQSARDFCRIWFFWKKQAVFVFLLIVGLAMIYAYSATPKYESTAQVLVLPKTYEGEVISAGNEEKRMAPVTTQDIYTEMELLGSKVVMLDTVKSYGSTGANLDSHRSVLGAITYPVRLIVNGFLRVLQLTPPAASEESSQVMQLKRSIKIEPIVESSVISIAMRSDNPGRAQDTLSKVLETYMQHRSTVFTKKDGLNFYYQQATDYKIKLDDAEKLLTEFQQKEDIVNLQVQNKSNIELLTKFKNDLKVLEISYDESASRATMLKQRILDDHNDIDGNLTKEMREIPAVIELNKGIVPLLITQSEISQSFTTESREYKDINNQIIMLRGAIRAEIEKAIKTDELELESMKIKIDALRQQIDLFRTEARDLNQKEKRLNELQRQVQLYQDSYLLYTRKAEDAKIFTQKSSHDLGNVSISSQPSLPEQPVAPNRLLLLMSSIFAGVFAALCLPFILESIDNKLKTADDIEKILGLPVVCTFSEIS
ncbi:MAG: GumC family protein [Proteobacteria bacterium]|nr:hypothetical protein [Desulfobulbaceae bacterium]MBU4152915.1 GumC family protein [Pseudomonadota bacterium]